MAEITAGDYFKGQRLLGDERSTELPLWVKWSSLSRAGETDLDYDAWLDQIPLPEVMAIVQEVNELFEDRADDDPTLT